MADQYAVPLSRCKKEDLLWIIKRMCMKDRNKYDLDLALSELAYEKKMQRINAADHYAKLADEKRREYIEILRPYKGISAADVAPVRHGRWIMKHRHRGGFHRYTGLDDIGEQHTITVDERVEYDDRYCSECGKQSADNFINYCPNCGAKMDGGDDNG